MGGVRACLDRTNVFIIALLLLQSLRGADLAHVPRHIDNERLVYRRVAVLSEPIADLPYV